MQKKALRIKPRRRVLHSCISHIKEEWQQIKENPLSAAYYEKIIIAMRTLFINCTYLTNIL